MLLIEIGTDMDAFGTADRLASWVGICPGNNESAGKLFPFSVTPPRWIKALTKCGFLTPANA